jgi:hypothetical protein
VRAAGVSVLVGAHRALFVAATALVGVAASQVAGETDAGRYWLLLGGAAVLMLTGDMLSSIETQARVLSQGSVGIREARNDVLIQSRPRTLVASMIAGVTLLVAGVVVPLPATHAKPQIVHVTLTCHAHAHLKKTVAIIRCGSSP